MSIYRVNVKLSMQEDGLWRAEVPELPGCFADAPTMHEALNDVQDCAAMLLDVYAEKGRAFPGTIAPLTAKEFEAAIPIALGEHQFVSSADKGDHAAS